MYNDKLAGRDFRRVAGASRSRLPGGTSECLPGGTVEDLAGQGALEAEKDGGRRIRDECWPSSTLRVPLGKRDLPKVPLGKRDLLGSPAGHVKSETDVPPPVIHPPMEVFRRLWGVSNGQPHRPRYKGKLAFINPVDPAIRRLEARSCSPPRRVPKNPAIAAALRMPAATRVTAGSCAKPGGSHVAVGGSASTAERCPNSDAVAQAQQVRDAAANGTIAIVTTATR